MLSKFYQFLATGLFLQFACFGQSNDAERYYDRGLDAFNQSKIDLAITYVDSVLQLNEWHTDALFLRANAFESQGEISKAIIDYEKIVYKDESYLEAFLAKSILYYQQKNYKSALADVKTVENYKGVHHTRALLFKSSVFGAGPHGSIDGVTTVTSLSDDLSYLKSLIYKDMGQISKAKRELSKLISREKKPNYLVALGLVYEKLGKNDSAKFVYQNALAIDPKYTSAAYQLQLLDPRIKVNGDYLDDEDFHYGLAKKAHELYREGDYLSALTYYNKAIKAGSEVSDYYSNRGLVFDKLKRYDDALLDFTTSLKKDGHMIVNYYRIGNVKVKQKEYDEAIASYTLYLSFVPEDADIQYNLAICYLNLKKYGDACKTIQLAEKYGKKGLGSIKNKYCRNL